MKGADYANGPYGLGRIIISVKGGENLNPAMVRYLAGVVQREKAQMGILIKLAEPSRGMRADANSYGFVSCSAHGRLPLIQIATVEDLLEGRLPKLPALPQPTEAPLRGRRRHEKDQLELMLPFAGTGGLQTEDGTIIDPRFYSVAVGN